MATERSYQNDAYAISLTAVIKSVEEADGSACLTFDRTIFFPEGGGQPCDLGEVTAADGIVYEVTKVYDKSLSGDVYHLVNAPLSAFAEGDTVILEIDWERRFTNMQRHSGEHILSGAFYKTCGGANKGFHMGEDYITIDIDMGGGLLTRSQIEQAEYLANTAIWDDLPISRMCFPDAEAASKLPVRKHIDIEGEISVVIVGDPEDPFDCVACCGTHTDSAGQIGLIKVYKAEPNKGMTRIYFDCGSKAFERYKEDMRILTEITNRYSTGSDGILHALDTEREKVSALKEHLAALQQYYKRKTVEEIVDAIERQHALRLTVSHTSAIASPDELLKTGFDIIGTLENDGDKKELLLIMIQVEEKTVLLISRGNINCSDLVKEYAPEFGGRGGGRSDNARAVFTKTQELNAFVSRIKAVVEDY